MIKHIVMWTVTGADKEQKLIDIKSKLEAMLATIKDIKFLEVGLNGNSISAAYDIVLVSEFVSWDALAAYQCHPDHEIVKKFIIGVTEKVAVVDYEIP